MRACLLLSVTVVGPNRLLRILVDLRQGFRHKKLRDREQFSLSLNCCFWPISVPNLARFVAPFVHFAIRPLL